MATCKQLGNLADDSMVELNALQETEGIIDYHEKFVLIYGKDAFPEPYLVSVYLAGLQTDTQMNIRMFQPQSIRQCLMIGKLYESVHPRKPKNSTNLDECSTNRKDSTKKAEPSIAFHDMPINLEEDVIFCSGPTIYASGTKNCEEAWSGEQSTMDLEVSDEATPRSTCFSSELSELAQPAVENNCVAILDEHVQVISIPLTNSMGMGYLVDSINMESMVDVIDCALVDEVFEQTNQFNTNLIQVTTSDAPKVFDRMPNRKVGLCSEELCSPVVRTLILQASNDSCTLWPDICDLVFDPGGVVALFVNRLPWNLSTVEVQMIYRRLQWDPGGR